MIYEKQILNVKVGAIELLIETFKDLDRAIDDLCASLPVGAQNDSLSEDLCPYFGVVWPASIALAKQLLRQKEQIQGKSILEIGCGLAIPSFVAHKLGGDVTATDFHLDVEVFLKRNQTLNNQFFHYQRLNWREEKEFMKFDYVIGSDILYESRHPHEVARALLKFVKPQGKIILADPGRSYLQNFVSSMNSLNYKEELIPIHVNGEDVYVLSYSV